MLSIRLGSEEAPYLVAQIWPCHIQRADQKLTLHYAKIIEYIVFQLSLSHYFVFITTSRQYLKSLGGLMERLNS